MITAYQISGMTCGHCAAAISEEVGALDGVKAVNVSHEKGTMQVESDERLPFDAIIGAVAEAGAYSVVES